MDFVEYQRIKKRLTKNCKIACEKCNIGRYKPNIACMMFEMNNPDKAVEIIKQWEKETTI